MDSKHTKTPMHTHTHTHTYTHMHKESSTKVFGHLTTKQDFYISARFHFKGVP